MRQSRQHKDQKDYDSDREKFFQESFDHIPPLKNNEFDEIEELCERERQQLNSHKKRYKNQRNAQEKQSSQFIPPQSEESFSYGSKMGVQASRTLSILIKQFTKQLTDPRMKPSKIKEIAEITKLDVDIVSKKVSRYFRKKKDTSKNSSNLQQRAEHQTIYKKTQMFDDAIKKVLKVTPYACINDLRIEICKKLNLELAKETLIRRLKNLRYTYTKFELTKKDRSNDDAKLKELRIRYIQYYKEISLKGNSIYFYGYCHIATDECKGSMWMKMKQNGDLDHVLYQKDVVHICIVLSKDRLEFFKICEGFYRSQSYRQTLNEWNRKRIEVIERYSARSRARSNLQPVKNCYLVSEVSQMHNEGSLLAYNNHLRALQESGVNIIAFPPFSYELNPAQVVFNQIKYLVKSKVKQLTQPHFSQAIRQVLTDNLDINDILFANKCVKEKYQECT